MPSAPQSIRASLVLISAAVRDIVVEILFRDLEYLLDKYMTDMRKVSLDLLVIIAVALDG